MRRIYWREIGGGLVTGGVCWAWSGSWLFGVMVAVIVTFALGLLLETWDRLPGAMLRAAEATETFGLAEKEAASRAAEYWTAIETATARAAPTAGVSFALATAATCGSEHVYDASTNTACPKCGQLDRITLGRSLRAREAAALLKP